MLYVGMGWMAGMDIIGHRSSMLYVHNFFLILTFVSYKLRLVAVDKGYSSEIDFEVIKVMSSHCLLNI